MEKHPTKAWDWRQNQDDSWHIASPESAYLIERWQACGFTRFLDLGCGLGRHSLAFARAGFQVTAADLSDYSVDWVRQAAVKEDLPVDSLRCNMLKLPLATASIEAVLAYNVIYHTDTAGFRKTLAEIRRVLQPGGEFFLTLLSKKTWGYQHREDQKMLDANTMLRDDHDTEKNVPHFYVDIADIKSFCRGFTFLTSPRECTDYDLMSDRYSVHWHLLLKKPSRPVDSPASEGDRHA